MFKTKIILPIIILLLTIFLIGCSGSGNLSIMSVQKSTSNSMNMSYASFNGKKSTSLTLKNGDKLVLNVTITTKAGNLKVTVTDEANKELYNIENPKKTVTKTIDISKYGTYKIQVEGKHSGSFNISWDIKH